MSSLHFGAHSNFPSGRRRSSGCLRSRRSSFSSPSFPWHPRSPTTFSSYHLNLSGRPIYNRATGAPVISPVVPAVNPGIAFGQPEYCRNIATPLCPPRIPPTCRFNPRHLPRRTQAPPCTPQRRSSFFTPLAVPSTLVSTSTMPVLPAHAPSYQAWSFPTGTLAWTPHPAPHPCISAAQFWQARPGPLGFSSPFNWPATPHDPATIARITGGWPLPSTQANWTPGVWPPVRWGAAVPIMLHPRLIPNPNNSGMPQLCWDVGQPPTTALRFTGNHVIVDAAPLFQETATHPPVNRLCIVANVGKLGEAWSWCPVVISKAEGDPITVWDILNGIYEHLHKQMTRDEVNQLVADDPRNYNILVDSCWRRSQTVHALPGYEQSQGFRRIDCFGDNRYFWGMWVCYLPDGTWILNVGLDTPSSLARLRSA